MTLADPYEGLPAHMIESIPLTVEVVFDRPGGPRAAMVDGERKIVLDGRPESAERVIVQLERGGVPLTMADRKGWRAGEREGWREWPGPKVEPEPPVLHDVEAEEIRDAVD